VDLRTHSKKTPANLAVPHWNDLLRHCLLQLALAGSLWLALSPLSLADWEIVSAHPVWVVRWCVASPFPPADVNYTPGLKPYSNCNFEVLRSDPQVLDVKSGTCSGQPGDLYDLEVTIKHWTGRIDVYDADDFKNGCALTYQCKAGTGNNGGPNIVRPGESPSPDSLLCRTWKPDSGSPLPSPPPPSPGEPVPDYYYIMLTDGSAYPDDYRRGPEPS
jgi:hypothetical protein